MTITPYRFSGNVTTYIDFECKCSFKGKILVRGREIPDSHKCQFCHRYYIISFSTISTHISNVTFMEAEEPA